MESVFELTKQNLKIIKKKSSLRRLLIADTLNINNSNDCVSAILNSDEKQNRNLIKKSKKIKKEQTNKLNAECSAIRENESNSYGLNESCEIFDDDLSVKEENEGPKNDYNQYFVDIGMRPQNFIRDPGLNERFEEYPKLRELIKLKDELIAKTNIPPMCLKSKLTNENNSEFPLMDLLGCEFDVILVEPPLHEYQNGVHFDKCFSWDEIKAIDIGSVAAQRSFIFLWCGNGDGLDKGRECLKKWGFRRCEDICWIKTNKKSPEHNRNIESGAIFQRTKEHCLMGIKGTVRRSLDSNFIHTNIDIDLIITEEPEYGCEKKPEEIFHIIEHFCLGKRRLYVFGRDNTIRPGWLSIGPDVTDSNFDKVKFKEYFDLNTNLTGSSERIEMLRPKTPPLKTKQIALNNSAVSSTNILQQQIPNESGQNLIQENNNNNNNNNINYMQMF